jgi:RNA polymerase sigma-32 factor
MKQGLAPMTRSELARVAAELKVKPEEVREMETRLSGQEMAFECDRDDEEGYAPVHYLADTSAEPSQVLEDAESERVRSEGLKKALSTLDPRSRRIIEARWLREKDSATLHDLAAEFKVSAERIRQIEAKALDRMRKALPAPLPN